jgi:hypothetical protein
LEKCFVAALFRSHVRPSVTSAIATDARDRFKSLKVLSFFFLFFAACRCAKLKLLARNVWAIYIDEIWLGQSLPLRGI